MKDWIVELFMWVFGGIVALFSALVGVIWMKNNKEIDELKQNVKDIYARIDHLDERAQDRHLQVLQILRTKS